MSAVGPESTGGAASKVPLLPPPSPLPLCRAPTPSRLSPGAGARGRAGGGAREMGRRARTPNIPPPLGWGKGARGRARGEVQGARLRPSQALWLRPPEPEPSDWYTGKCSRPLFFQSRNRMLFLLWVPLVAQIQLFVLTLRCASPTLVRVGGPEGTG